MKTTTIEFFREIKKSSGRFVSILFIVALGVAFFSGIRASEPDMRVTGDAYFDQANLMDIKVISTLGLTKDDVKAFEGLDSIDKAEGAYSGDFLNYDGEKQRALHVMSLSEDINQITVTEGRLPEKSGECLADDESTYKVGDKIKLTSGTEDPVTDTLTTDELTVVGTGNSPYYISYGRGSTTIGNGSLSAFLVVPKETFTQDVYTECYLLVKGAKECIAYTDEYEDLIDDAMDDVKELSNDRGIIRRRELVDDATRELDQAKIDLKEGKAKAEQELSDAETQIADAESQLADAKEKIRSGREQIEEAKNTLTQKQQELDQAKAQYADGMQQLQDGRAQYEAGKTAFEAGKPEAEQKITEGEAALEQIQAGIDTCNNGLKALKDMCGNDESIYGNPDTEIGAQYAGLVQQLEGLEQQKTELSAQLQMAKDQLVSAEQQLSDTKAALDASEAALASVPAQLTSGQEQINAGWQELSEKEQELEKGMSEITENENKISDAKQDLEEGRTKAAQDIADGEDKIADGEKKIDDIPEAEWYIYDRSTLPEYNGYGENADRMKAIGKVFPVLFFLVAALISLTGMTRMVEEQRVQIGTMKALGYRRSTIAMKYIGYAFLATITGSILGVLVGEKILPYIIIYSYGILYHHIPEILVPYVPSYGIMASAAAIACTLMATIFACYKELGAQPSELMRPPAPKVGKRVFLERIPFVWKRLNFSWKSTVRNLMRYKKRFFMTIFGIGGCMALMIVGYGLRDSVYEIADIQYSEIQLYDGQIVLQEDLNEQDREHLNTFLDTDKEVESYMDAYMKSITLKNGKKERQAYITVFGDVKNIGRYVDFHDRKSGEKYKLTDDGVIICEKTAKLLNAKVGDRITIPDEKNGDKELTISHICENYMGHYIYMTPAYYNKVFGTMPEYNSVLFETDDSYSQTQVEDVGEKIMKRDEVLSISYVHDIQEQLDEMLSSLNLVIIVLIISAGMLAFVVLYNLNTINITERQRELATLKVLGFYDGEVAQYVFRENILLTFIGAAVGVVLGKVLHLFTIQTVEVDAAMFGRSIYLPSFIYSLLFTVGFSLLINWIMYFKLKKINMVESLKSVE